MMGDGDGDREGKSISATVWKTPCFYCFFIDLDELYKFYSKKVCTYS